MRTMDKTPCLWYDEIMAQLKQFPIGIQDFEKLRKDGKYYVDKTDLIYTMTHTDSYYFRDGEPQ